MKLIRLTTTDTSAYFDKTFSDELVLPRGGKIALQNIAVHLDSGSFQINEENNSIFYQNSTTGEIEIVLDNATYNAVTYFSLLTDIQNKLNMSTSFTGTNTRVLGIEWAAHIQSGKTKVDIEYGRGDPDRTDDFSTLTEIQVTPADGSLGEAVYLTIDSEDSPGAQDFFNTRITKAFISRGNGYTRAHIYGLNQSGTPAYSRDRNGMILCLTDTNMNGYDPMNFTDDLITYGIWASVNASNVRVYHIFKDGVQSAVATVPTYVGDGDDGNDDLEITVNGGKVELNVYQTGVKVNLATYDYTPGTPLYPVEVYKGGNQVDTDPYNASFSEVNYTPSPFNPITNLSTIPPQPSTIPYTNYLRFGSLDLAEHLGYEFASQPERLVTIATYPADYAYTVFSRHDAFLVELLNIPLDSYDSYTTDDRGNGQRKNILAVVPVSDRQGEIIYEPNTPFFINIKNENELLLRNIRARILNSDYQPLLTRGLTTLTLLVD
jgi:hypothetical protein